MSFAKSTIGINIKFLFLILITYQYVVSQIVTNNVTSNNTKSIRTLQNNASLNIPDNNDLKDISSLNNKDLKKEEYTKLALYTYRYGIYPNEDDLKNSRDYFLSHLKSVSGIKDVTFIYVVDKVDELIQFPPNTRVIVIDFEKIVSKLENFLKAKFPHLHKIGSYYKLVDFKPIFPLLYPELFEMYTWIGWIDNDMWFSSLLSNVVTAASKDPSHVHINFLKKKWIGGSPHYSWGPIAVFRWSFYWKYIMPFTLLENNRKKLIEVFRAEHGTNFAEWGDHEITHFAKGYDYSFSRILYDIHSKNKNLKITFAEDYVANENIIGMHSDRNICLRAKRHTRDCGLCVVSVDSKQTRLIRTVDGTHYDNVVFCHFQEGKKRKVSSVLNITMEQYQSSSVIASTYNEGIKVFQTKDAFSKGFYKKVPL